MNITLGSFIKHHLPKHDKRMIVSMCAGVILFGSIIGFFFGTPIFSSALATFFILFVTYAIIYDEYTNFRKQAYYDELEQTMLTQNIPHAELLEDHSSLETLRVLQGSLVDDDVTKRVATLTNQLVELTDQPIASTEVSYVLTRQIPSDLTALLDVYLSFNQTARKTHQSKTIRILSLLEAKVNELSHALEVEKEQKLNYLHEIYAKRYQNLS